MPHLVTALFENHAQAGAALQALVEMGVAADRIAAIGMDEGREGSSISGFRELSARDDRLAALQDLNLPVDDEHLFERGLLSGYALIAAQVDRHQLDQAIDVLGMFDPLDLDRDTKDWAKLSPEGPEPGSPLGAGISGGAAADGLTNTGALPGMRAMTGATDDLGTADIRTDEATRFGKGVDSTTSTGRQREDERAEQEGVNALRTDTPPPAPRTGPLQRAMNRGGRVWAYGTDES